MLLFDASGTPTATPQPTPTPMPTHHFLPTRTPTPFMSVLATPMPPVSAVRGTQVTQEAPVASYAWVLNLVILVAIIWAIAVDKVRKGVYNKHARVDR